MTTNRLTIQLKIPEQTSTEAKAKGIDVKPGTANVTKEESADAELMKAIEEMHKNSLETGMAILEKFNPEKFKAEKSNVQITDAVQETNSFRPGRSR